MAEPGLAGSSQFTTMVLAVVSPKVGASRPPRRVVDAGRAGARVRPAARAFRVRSPAPGPGIPWPPRRLAMAVAVAAPTWACDGPVGRPGLAVLHVVVADGGAGVGGAVQLTSMPVSSPRSRSPPAPPGPPAPRRVHVGDRDGHRHVGAAVVAVARPHGERDARRRLVVLAGADIGEGAGGLEMANTVAGIVARRDGVATVWPSASVAETRAERDGVGAADGVLGQREGVARGGERGRGVGGGGDRAGVRPVARRPRRSSPAPAPRRWRSGVSPVSVAVRPVPSWACGPAEVPLVPRGTARRSP